MPYYIVSFNRAFKKFQERFPHLKNATWVSSEISFQDILNDLPESAVFLFEFTGDREAKDEFVLSLRESGNDIKIIYVTDHNATQDLKAHQTTPAGADAYFSMDSSALDLKELIESLSEQAAGTPGEVKAGEAFELEALEKMKSMAQSQEIDRIFKAVIKDKNPKRLPKEPKVLPNVAGVEMSKKEEELSLDDLGEFQLDDMSDSSSLSLSDDDDASGVGLNLDEGMDLDLGGNDDLSLDDSDGLNLSLDEEVDDGQIENLGELDFGNMADLSLDDAAPAAPVKKRLPVAPPEASATATRRLNTAEADDLSLSFTMEGDENDVSPEVKEKLKEIDAIMDGSSKIDIEMPSRDADPDVALVSDDMNLDDLDFSIESSEDEQPAPSEERTRVQSASRIEAKPEKAEPKRKKKEIREVEESYGENIRDISGAYAGDLERTQLTIANLRADRDELLNRIQLLEDEKVMHSRQGLTMRAELDEKKIELSIIRRKLNEEISELKDKMRIHEERRLILEEKNRHLTQEVERAGQVNKLDMKKVQMRERELEQKLELLKSDAETQIRNRDLKILELKRKIDAMEFDMESITTQEKRSVESRFELEDKLDKAIRTLRSAITVLEEEGDINRLEAIKKNIDI